eukprot:scaffold314033_cov33-Tisochrysis_lutea.AAC.3
MGQARRRRCQTRSPCSRPRPRSHEALGVAPRFFRQGCAAPAWARIHLGGSEDRARVCHNRSHASWRRRTLGVCRWPRTCVRLAGDIERLALSLGKDLVPAAQRRVHGVGHTLVVPVATRGPIATGAPIAVGEADGRRPVKDEQVGELGP